LDRIITQIVKPKVSVYMAIDGVAPRAKLNQQRSRRFRSAKDLAEATKDLPKDNKEESGVFDSNCITPGTEFLAKVSETIQYFIRKKMKEDPIWHNLTVIFSGADIPGEGEHKVCACVRACTCVCVVCCIVSGSIYYSIGSIKTHRNRLMPTAVIAFITALS
jgi:5'-3' exoribonuclease 1